MEHYTVPNCTVYAYGLPPEPYWTLDPGDMVLRFRHQDSLAVEAVSLLRDKRDLSRPKDLRLLLELDGLQPLSLAEVNRAQPNSHVMAAWAAPQVSYHLARLGPDGWSGKPGYTAVELMDLTEPRDLLTYQGDGKKYYLVGFYTANNARLTMRNPLKLSSWAQETLKELLNK